VIPYNIRDRKVSDNRFDIIPYRTRFYQKTKSGTVENADFLDSSYKIPGGVALVRRRHGALRGAILDDKLVKPATRELMWTPLKPSDGSKDTYGLGWGVGDKEGIQFVGHSGGQQGTSTDFLIAPKQRAGVVVLTNMQGLDANGLAVDILKILIGKSAEAGKE
jgi:serine beta-lactamase-like protein LACTB, mitochondrial